MECWDQLHGGGSGGVGFRGGEVAHDLRRENACRFFSKAAAHGENIAGAFALHYVQP